MCSVRFKKKIPPNRRTACIIRMPIELSGAKDETKKQQYANWKRMCCGSCQFSQGMKKPVQINNIIKYSGFASKLI